MQMMGKEQGDTASYWRDNESHALPEEILVVIADIVAGKQRQAHPQPEIPVFSPRSYFRDAPDFEPHPESPEVKREESAA